ncbi:PPC domain-containing DNA-binding protein [Thermocoleostomius sinensis]|uniref:DNA-binding protein n=1 Tax=Thermocoleostomius sinensis A174 TaxID=2016057 RepID=A0A9E9CB35_9CYAN|nr:PPC domain-containing DNA-binding protein [Thermocoleostomius sinensis]WAL59750.1 DNA-binding protein [Thermocoleostomius sinensis A174]
METTALRLKPQQDLKQELDRFVQDRSITAACVFTCVGSLTQATLRLAGQPQSTIYQEKFEIVSLTGLMSQTGSHYHIAIADSNGRTIGGHVLEGCLIYTTAEIVIGILPHFSFQREYDSNTGYRELTIDHVSPAMGDIAAANNAQPSQ